MIITFIYLAALLLVVALWLLYFRRRQDAAWRQLATEMGAEFIPGGLFATSKVLAKVKDWTVTLDVYSVPSGDSNTTYTRMRAPLHKKDAFQFTVFRTGLVARLDNKLRAQDIAIGDAEFDHDFTIQGNDEARVRALLANLSIRQLIQAQKRIRLGIRKDELVFEAQGVIKDIERLKSLFELFKQTLTQLEG